jgi:putative addiction module killer protein
MRAALAEAAPVYRQALWPAHQASNEAFIRRMRNAVAPYHDEMATTLARVYRTPWLQQPYRTDVVQYADWEGSYSNNSDGYAHIVMSAQDHYDGDMSIVDVIFHEASHSIADPEYGTIGSAITRAVHRDDVLAPDQFWHAVITYTPGKVVEQIAARAGGGYRMVWMMPGLFGGAWSRYNDALQRCWLPYVRGEGSLEGAIAIGRAKIVGRIARLQASEHWGDARPVGDGITELRVDYGPGYRVYCKKVGRVVVLLLVGGDKSTQKATSSGQRESQRHGKRERTTALRCGQVPRRQRSNCGVSLRCVTDG